ncbi:MAG: malonyl CoA-acyl carrier protein transacylase, partial [Actinomycetota bacterium]|nr:malonyl CoA-acyl carrier protein transacylase [Actinomycetota bacterium]
AAFAVWGNADATPIADPVDALARQLVSPVRFTETLLAMAAAGIGTFVHLGPGEVTAGLARRTLPAATVHVVGSVDDVAAVASAVH